jgi:tetratricopeptide (TPR) repeat protein
VPPFDREGALKSAEKALRQGRIDAAIQEYLKVIAAQPRDWNSANALGDLYVRAGQTDKGLAQYLRIADHLSNEGFYPKASALYKKVIKIKPDAEEAYLKMGDLAAKQGLLADAKQHFQTVADRRRARGDKAGAAALNIRLGTLDPDDLDARLGAAKSAAEVGDTVTALREYKDVSARFDEMGRANDALAALQAAYDLSPADEAVRERLFTSYLNSNSLVFARQMARGAAELKRVAAALDRAERPDAVLEVLADVAVLDPSDVEVRAGLAQAYVSKGDLERARSFLSPETAGKNAALWVTLGEIELRAGRLKEGRAAIAEALSLDRGQREAAVALGCRLAEIGPDQGYPCIDAVADAALTEDDFPAAAAALHEFVTRVRNHLVALMRLVEVCVDGSLEATMYEAQAQLADAYIGVGRGLEARIISEDLVAREPWNRANIERFRRSLVMLGESDPDAIIAERLSGESPFMTTDHLDLNEGFEEAIAAPVEEVTTSAAPQTTDEEEAPAIEVREVREDVGRVTEDHAAEQYRLALTYLDMGMNDDAFRALAQAAKSPRQRFDAASMLGRLYREQGDAENAVNWFEKAAEAPAPTADAGRALLYDLAETLEEVGEQSRALAVLVDLEAESGGYRDVSRRIERLSKLQPRG